MKTRSLVIIIIIFTIIPTVSAHSSPSCDASSTALVEDSVKTAVSGKGNTIAIGGANGMIGLFTSEGSPRWVYRIHDPVTGIATSKDGRFIAATTFYGDLFYFDEKGYMIWNQSGFGCDSHVILSENGQEGYVFSSSPTHDLTGDTVFHFASNGSVLSHLPVPGVSAYDLSEDGYMAVVNSGDSLGNNYIVAIDDTGIQWEKKIPSQGHVPDVAISDDCRTVAAIEPGSLTVFSCSGRTLWNISTKYIAKSVAVSSNGHHVAVGTQYRILYFNRSGVQLWEYSIPDYVTRIQVSDNGTNIVATTRKNLYYLNGNGTSLWQYSLPDWTNSLSMSDTGNLIAAGTYNNTFTILDGGGKAKEIKLDTMPVMPMVTAESESQGNLSVSPTRSRPAFINPLLVMIACGTTGLFLRRR